MSNNNKQIEDNPLNRRKEVYLVQNTKGGKEGNLTFDVQLFEDLEEAKQWCDGKEHLHIVKEWIVAKQPTPTKEQVQDIEQLANAAWDENHPTERIAFKQGYKANTVNKELKREREELGDTLIEIINELQRNRIAEAYELAANKWKTIFDKENHAAIKAEEQLKQ